MLVSILLFSCVLFSIFGFFILFPFGLYQYSPVPLFTFCVFYVLFVMWFQHRCRKYINLNKTFIKIEKFIQKNDKNEGYIIFKSINNIYSCEGVDSTINFDLNGFMLKKSFIRAFVLRQMRYKTVSEKLKISKLFSLKLKCKYKYDKLYLVINNHKYIIFSNGISKNTILSSEISKAKFAYMYNSFRGFVDCNMILQIDEKRYLDFFKFYKNF